jgi:hypothetical protein
MRVLTKGCPELYIGQMAKQAGTIFIEGTIDDLTFYKMEGRYYVRMKSSLTGKKFWRSKAFERSRESCKRFAKGNGLASKVYRMIDKEKRVYSLYCFLKRRAILLLKEGKSLRETEEALMDYLRGFGVIEEGKNRVMKKKEEVIGKKKVIRKRNDHGVGEELKNGMSVLRSIILLEESFEDSS